MWKCTKSWAHAHRCSQQSLWFFYLKGDCSCSAAGNLFYLNGTSMCLSPAHLLTWYSSQTELSLHGMRGGKKLRSSLRTIRLSHIVLQFSDYRDTETQTQTRICKESHGEKNTTNSNCARATSRSFLSERAVGQVNFQGVSSQPHGIKRDAQQRGIERLKH